MNFVILKLKAASAVAVPPPTISVFSGSESLLTWSTTDAVTVTISQGIGAVALSGTRAISDPFYPNGGTITYVLTATNSSGSVTSSVSITYQNYAAQIACAASGGVWTSRGCV